MRGSTTEAVELRPNGQSVDRAKIHTLAEGYLAGVVPAERYFAAVAELAEDTVEQELTEARDRRRKRRQQ